LSGSMIAAWLKSRVLEPTLSCQRIVQRFLTEFRR
jgi:hypothetical protein